MTYPHRLKTDREGNLDHELSQSEIDTDRVCVVSSYVPWT